MYISLIKFQSQRIFTMSKEYPKFNYFLKLDICTRDIRNSILIVNDSDIKLGNLIKVLEVYKLLGRVPYTCIHPPIENTDRNQYR